MKKILFVIIALFFCSVPVHASEYAETVPDAVEENTTEITTVEDTGVTPDIPDTTEPTTEYIDIGVEVPFVEPEKNVEFGYIKELPASVTQGDLYVLQVKLYNLILTLVWLLIAMWLFDLLFTNFAKFHKKRGA